MYDLWVCVCVGGWSCRSDCSAWQSTMYGVWWRVGGRVGERRGGCREARGGERGIVNVLKKDSGDCLLMKSRAGARWREKEPSAVIECEREAVPIRSGESWRGIKHTERERERAAGGESTGWNVDMWTSATADLVSLCDGVDTEWSAVTGNHEALAQSGLQADQWVSDVSAARSWWPNFY